MWIVALFIAAIFAMIGGFLIVTANKSGDGGFGEFGLGALCVLIAVIIACITIYIRWS